MSYDLAVWEGPQPASDAEAAETYEALVERYHSAQPAAAPTPTIRAFVDALLDRWPDITAAGGDASPWSDGPMINNATGSLIYFGMVYSMAGEASAFSAEVARGHGLVCFDPQTMELRPSD